MCRKDSCKLRVLRYKTFICTVYTIFVYPQPLTKHNVTDDWIHDIMGKQVKHSSRKGIDFFPFGKKKSPQLKNRSRNPVSQSLSQVVLMNLVHL